MNKLYMILPGIAAAAIYAGFRAANRVKKLDQFYNEYKGGQYCFGGSDPTTGFDCSGLTSFYYANYLNQEIPRRARNQAAAARPVSTPRPGDLVFFASPGSSTIDHVGLYYGDDVFIHSGTNSGVSKQSLNLPYWQQRFKFIGRI
jgi:cell wall-associated NlpC family hydrolase